MEIKFATDWPAIDVELLAQIGHLPFNKDLRKLHANISVMVIDLSKLEVEARRLRAPYKVESKLNEINAAIKHLEQLILMAILIQTR